jgi:hypothetical protein
MNIKTIELRMIFICLMLPLVVAESWGQKPPAVNVRDSVKIAFDGKKISINYGRLTMRQQKIFGSYVPYYKVWRTGTGTATTLTTDADIEVDGAVVPHGVYSLYTYPTESHWKLIINKQTGQWGTVYNAQYDLARIDLKITRLKNTVRNLTFRLERMGDSDGLLKIEWERTSLSVPFHISFDGIIASPRDSSVLFLQGKRLSINYGSPSVRGRKIIGGVVPYGVVWRTGANEATSFITETDLFIGKKRIPKGAYTLYTLPTSGGWKLIVNSQTGQWGTVYNKKMDLVRIPMNKKNLKKAVEKLKISLERTGSRSGTMILEWEKTRLTVDLKVG